MKMFKWQQKKKQTNKHVLSIYLKEHDSRKQATFLNFGGNFLIFEQLKSNFWVYCEATFPEFTSKIYSCLPGGLFLCISYDKLNPTSLFGYDVERTTSCQIERFRSLMHHINYNFMLMSAY